MKYLGWRDPFARAAHSDRQRDYVKYSDLSQVYTPGIVVDGREWRKWFATRGQPSFEPTAAGVLRLSIEGDQFSAAFDGAEADTLHIVWLGFDMVSSIDSGENRGRELRHDFVVLSHASFLGESTWQGALPAQTGRSATTALAAWVSRGNLPHQRVELRVVPPKRVIDEAFANRLSEESIPTVQVQVRPRTGRKN